MRITESRLRSIIRSVIKESVGIEFEVAERIEDMLYQQFGFSSFKVLSVKEDREDKNSLYALVHCTVNNKWATIYQDDEGDQDIDSVMRDERRTRSDFDNNTTGEELFYSN